MKIIRDELCGQFKPYRITIEVCSVEEEKQLRTIFLSARDGLMNNTFVTAPAEARICQQLYDLVWPKL